MDFAHVDIPSGIIHVFILYKNTQAICRVKRAVVELDTASKNNLRGITFGIGS